MESKSPVITDLITSVLIAIRLVEYHIKTERNSVQMSNRRFRQSVLVYRFERFDALDYTTVLPVVRLTRFSSCVQM